MAFRAVASRPSPGLQTPPRQRTMSPAKAAPGTPAAAAKASKGIPSTPTGAPSTPTTDSPGNWRHPRLEEITKRRAATVFTETNLRTAVYNGLALGAVSLARNATGAPFKQLAKLARSVLPAQWSGVVVLLLQTVFVINIVRALLPLFRQQDTLADIPLTPSQRKLLGLPALKSATPTQGAGYSTPPRYARTPSVSGSPASAATAKDEYGGGKGYLGGGSPSSSVAGDSPLYSKTRNAANVGGVGSPYSPSSPFARVRRSSSIGSFGSPGGPGGGSQLISESTFSSIPGTPSPTGKRLSMGLNSKWLYEKGRRSSGGARMN